MSRNEMFNLLLLFKITGLYLYMLVVETFTGENIKLRVYVIIGWGKATFNSLIILFFNFVNSIKEEKESYVLMYVPCILCNFIVFVQQMHYIYINDICFL
jgi:hypothetical protein